MERKRWLAAVLLIVAGGVVGAGAIVTTTIVNRATSTEAFCTSCHSMAGLAADPHYRQSAHRANAAGVPASCADCHVPSNNWFVETYSHLVDGVRDGIAEYTGSVSDPAVWSARLPVLAERVREEMRKDGGVTCRKCHDPAAIRPPSEAGRAAHAMLGQTRMACISCHSNLVHAQPAAGATTSQASDVGQSKP
jgi:nitrate/TMAO reductase-like tetraheme cytochrome c subunit